MEAIYLDHNATTPLCPEAAAAMAECQSAAWANPESQHQLGRRARRVLEDAREGIAEIMGVELNGPYPDRLIFTSGGTEANNLALFGLTKVGGGEYRDIVISAVEHPSVANAAGRLAAHGARLTLWPVDADGVVKGDVPLFSADGGRIASEVRRTSPFFPFVSVMLANNETGVVQPIEDIVALCKEAGAIVHTDAVQAFGKIPVNFRRLGVHGMTIAAHKFGGPRGIGALALSPNTLIEPQIVGGAQQNELRGGTEPVVLITGMYAALRAFARERDARIERITALRNRLESALLEAWPLAIIHGTAAPRLPNTTCIAFSGLDRQALVMALDLAGVCCSTGSACASGSSEPSPTLLAMGLSEDLVASSIRFSLGATTTTKMIDEAALRITRVLKSQPATRSSAVC